MKNLFRSLRPPVLAGGTATAGILLATVIIFLFALAVVYGRGISHAALFLSDSFVFFDGIHRVAKGQVPNSEIWSPVGPIPYFLPYLGYRMTGTYAGAVEMASLFVAAATLAAASVLLWRRTSPAMAILILGTIAAVIVVPLVPGMDAQQVSHAMQYNRWGWGFITALFLVGLPGDNGTRWVLLAGVLTGGLLTALFLTKITYFLVAGAYLTLLLVFPGAGRRLALIALAAAAGMFVVMMALHSGVIFGYIASIREALAADGAVRGSHLDIAFASRDSLAILLIAVYAVLLRPSISLRTLALVGFIALSGIALIDQNYQFKFIVALPVAFAILTANAATASEDRLRIASVIVASAYVAVAPFAADWARVTLQYMRPPSGQVPGSTDPRFAKLYVYEDQPALPEPAPYSGTYDVNALVNGDIPISHVRRTEFFSVQEDGIRLLTSLGANQSEITTLDFVNTMPLMVDAPRTAPGYSWLHFGRNVSEDSIPKGAEMFKGIDYIMVPLKSPEHPTVIKLLGLYGDYLKQNTTVAGHSKFWVLLRHTANAAN